MTDFPELPDFLRATGPSKAPQISVKQKRRREKKRPFDLPKSMDATAWELLRQREKEKLEKREARFKALRELRKR